MKLVLRLGKGDACLIADGSGREAEAVVNNFAADGRVELKIVSILESPREKSGTEVRVCPALLQKGKMDTLVRWAQELGVREMIPIVTERTVCRLSAAAEPGAMGRWLKIAAEAAKQSGSIRLLTLTPVSDIRNLWQRMKPGQTVAIFHPGAGAVPFESWILSLRDRIKKNRSPHPGSGACSASINLLFGPEGGFAPKEVETALASCRECGLDAAAVGLGPSVLKADTAFLGVVAALRFLLDSENRS